MNRRVLAVLAVLAVLVGGVFLAWRVGLITSGGSLAPLARDPWTTGTTVHSDLLGRDMPIEVFQPPSTCTARGLLILFHGRGGDERQWMEGQLADGVGVDKVAHRLIVDGRIAPLVIVSAFIDDSYGVDSEPAGDGYEHGPYERFIVEELVPAVLDRFPGPAPLPAVGGLSMGGFAALNVAFDHPDLFSAVGALSPAFFVSAPADRTWIYEGGGRQPLLDLAERGAADSKQIFLGYGERDYDWIRQAASRLATTLSSRGEPSDPVVVPGGHDVGTWRQLAEPMLLRLFGSTAGGCS